CECGTTVLIPLPEEIPAITIADATPPPVADQRPPGEPTTEPRALAEIIAPTPVSVRAGRGPRSERRLAVMAGLTPGTLWIQDVRRLRSLALQDFECESRRNGKELTLTLARDPTGEVLTLTFASAAQGLRWYDKIQALKSNPISGACADDCVAPDGVDLVRR